MSPQGTAQGRSLSFTIPGRIGGKGRHRSFVRDGKMIHASHAKTASDEATVRQFAALAMARGAALLQGALSLEVNIYRLIPKSWSGKRREAAFWITGKPDCDNQIKLLSDAMNGIVYQDDSQIAAITMRRMYGLPECIGITVAELT